jgi:hypothetical protein
MMVRYWEAEPWGAWRDNIHAALVAREVRRSVTASGYPVPPLLEWMLVKREERVAAEKGKVFDFFRSMAKRVKRNG